VGGVGQSKTQKKEGERTQEQNERLVAKVVELKKTRLKFQFCGPGGIHGESEKHPKGGGKKGWGLTGMLGVMQIKEKALGGIGTHQKSAKGRKGGGGG